MPSFQQFRNPRPNIRRAPVVGNGDVLSPQQVSEFNAAQGMRRNQAFLESRQPQAPRQTVSRYGQSAQAPGIATTGKPIYHVQRPDGSLVPVAAISGDRALIDTGKHFISPSTGKRFVTDPASATGMRDIGTEADEIAAKQAAAQAKAAAKAQAEATKAAEKGADEATKLAHAQKANEFTAQGRAFYYDKVTGEPRARVSNEEWKASQAEKGAKLQEAAATKTRRAQLAKLEFDFAQVNIKDKDIEDADEAVASAKEGIAALRTAKGMLEADAYTKDFDEAELSTPQGAAYKLAEQKRKELADKAAARDALKQQIAEAKLRIEAPEAYAELMAEKVKGETPEVLDARESEQAAQIQATKAEIATKQAKLDAAEKEHADALATAKQRYTEATQTGDPNALKVAGENLQVVEQAAMVFEERSQAERDKLNAEVDEVNRDVGHLGIISTERKRRQDTEHEKTVAAFEAAAPGMGREYQSLVDDGSKRAEALRTKYKGREESPEAKAAFDALQKDITGKAEIIKGEVETRQKAKSENLDKLWNQFGVGQELGTATMRDWVADKSTDPEYDKLGGVSSMPANFKAKIKELGLDEKEARNYMETRRQLDWSSPLDPEKAEKSAELTRPLREKLGITDMLEPVRRLPNGAIIPNPVLGGDEEAFKKAIEATEGTSEQKAEAMKLWPSYRRQYGEGLLAAFAKQSAFGTDFNEWRNHLIEEDQKVGGKNGFAAMDTVDQALMYQEQMKGRSFFRRWADLIASNVTAGFMDVTQAALGSSAAILGAVPGIGEGLSNLAGANAENAASLVNTQDQLSNTGLAGSIAATIARMAPGVAATVGTGSMAGGMVFGGAQTAGSLYGDAYNTLRDQGKSHMEAWKASAPASLAAGAMTAGLTKLFPGGVTALANNPEARASVRAMVAGFLSSGKAIAKGALDEIPEEVIDEAMSQLAQGYAEGRNPDDVVRDFITGLPELVVASGLMGGGMQAIKDRQDRRAGGQDAAATTPDGPLPEEVEGIKAAIAAFNPTAPEAIQAMPAAIRSGPKNQLPSEITAKARASMGAVAGIASGEITKPSQLTETQMRALGVKLDKGGKLVPAGGANAPAPLIYTRADKAGNDQIVITDEARDWLKGALPDLAIGQSEAERIQAIATEKPVAETGPVNKAPAPEATPEAQPGSSASEGAAEGVVIPQASPDRQAKVDSLRAQGGDVVVVQDEAAAEALIGAPLVNKGRRGVTTRVNGKPTVVLIQSNMDGDSRSVDALLDEELHHAATLMVMDESPDLAAAAEQEAAAITKGDVIHSDFQKLSAKGRVVEAAAAYASGKWKPGKQSKIKAMVDTIVSKIAKALNITTKEAKPLAVDAIRRLAAEAEAKITPKAKSAPAREDTMIYVDGPPANQPDKKADIPAPEITPTVGETDPAEVDTEPAKGRELIGQAHSRMAAVVQSFAMGDDKQKATAAAKAILDGLRRYNGHIPIVLTDDPAFDFAWGRNEKALIINPETALARFVSDSTDADNAAAQARQFFRHELIHKFVVSQLGDARVMDIWNQLPKEVQDQVQKAYSVRLVARGKKARKLNSDLGGHEYYRAMLEAMKDGTMTEQVIGKDLADKWRKFLDDVLSLLRDLRKQFASIKSESARNDLIKQVDQDIKLVSDALDAFEKSISPGAESAQTANTEAGSTSGKPVEGSSTTVATPVSIKSEKESSAKPWQMIRAEFIEKNGRRPKGVTDGTKTIGARISTLPNGETWNTDEHGQEVYAALLRGENVPAEVIVEYPMLQDVKATAKVPKSPKPDFSYTNSATEIAPGSSYPYKWRGYASTNEGGRLAVDAGGSTPQEARDNALSLLVDRFNARKTRQSVKTQQDEPTSSDGTRIKMAGVWYSKQGNSWIGENSENPSPTQEGILDSYATKFQAKPAKPAEPSREEWQKTYAKFKRALAKAVKAKDYAEIIRQADAFQSHYEADGNGGFPDTWSDWERHKSDAEFQLARQGDAPLRPLVVPVLKPVTPPRPAASEDADYLKAQEDARAALGGLFASPTVRSIIQLEVPAERFDAVRKAAVSILNAKIRTPEGFAKFMDDTFPGGKARPYSEAIWDMMGIADKSLRGSHDWTSIYAGIDKPLPEVEDSADDTGTLEQRPDGVESGNADSTGDTRTESGSSGGRVGSDESIAPEADGEEPVSNPESAGSTKPTGARGGTSGSGRDDASIGPGDRGDVRGESQPRVEATANYTITDADKIGEGGLKVKYADNVAAIRLVKQLQSESRKPTTAEQKVLVRYVGWGGMKNVFDGTNAKWADQHKEVKDLLSDDEFSAARRSTMDAHYTSPTVIKNGIWGALKRFGFTGGKMLEGGVGIGHMIGLMPGEMRPTSSYLGIEKDPITAQIATYLYPEASIHSTGFEQATVERDHFDAAAGNPPFGQQQLYDPNFKAASKFSIHNYFIAKHIEALRVGGVGAWVVSHNFLDALDPAAREYIASKAEFLGAIRLPNTAFKANANTEVTTDIVYFRRVPEGTATDTAWTKSTKQSDKDGNTYSLNDWINNHRDMILGTLDTTGSMYGPGELTVTAPPAQDLALDLAAAVENLPADVYNNDPSGANIRLATPEYIPVPDGVRVGAYFIGEKGELRRRLSDSNMESRSAPVEMPEGTTERVRGMVELRDTFNAVVAAELDNTLGEKELGRLRSELNRVYDAFVKKHGLLHQTGNRRAFFSDPHAARILGLESDYDAGVSAPTAKKNNVPARKPSAKKADIFTRRVNSPYSEITKVETSKEALTVALNQRGLVDLDYMAQLSGIDRDTLLRELDGLIFETPQGEWQVASQYLSGNVRKKLAEAEEAANGNPRFNANVEALKNVQPPDLEATQVTVTPGAPWIMADVLKQFALDLTGEDASAVVYNSANGGWIFTHPSNSTNSTQVWGTPKAGFETLFTNILNNKPTIIHLPRGKDDPLVVDAQNTALAQAKSDAIRDKWATWIWEDQTRRDALLKIYNDKFNVYVDPKYDGSHLTLPGISSVVTLRPHQKDVVWRIMTDLTVLLDHVVGAGKTFAGVAAFMELRRLGRVRKPMFAVPNHLVTQWRDDFVKLYPNANVLFARPSDFKKDKRQQLFAKIMTGEYDAVIVGHSSLKKIRMSPEIERELLNEMLTEIADTLKAVADAEGKRGSRAQTQLERQKESLEAKLSRLADIGSGDEVATFEELGIDGLFVDEAHEFKNLFYTTQMQNVAGLGNPAGSAKAFDLYLKTRHLRKRYGGKAPLVFATGTPISNSLVEMFTMQRYLQPDVLDSMGIKTLDAWAKVFATVKQVYEVNPTGTGMRLATRLAQFQNVGDLSAVYRTVADVITMSDLFAQAEAQGKKFPIPKVKGGKPQIYAVERTPDQEKYFGVETQKTTESGEPIYDGEGNPIFEYPEGSINWRVDNMPDDPREDNMLKLTSDARKAALDMRLVDPNATDHPESKINTTVRNILATAKQWDAQKGTQLVFCDLSVPSSARGKAKAKALEAIGQISWIKKGDQIVRVEKTKPVAIPGVEDLNFFIRKEGREWMITESSSGGRISAASTEADAIDQAAHRIARMGVDSFRAAIEKNKPSTEELAAFFAAQETAAPEQADTEESDVADDTETTVSMDELLAEESKFSVYDDLKAKLIAGGLAPNQVEFIHDHDSPEKKAILFARMNKGDVRVLIGSTPKLGAGTNVQKKLVALHHMDAPWRPSDLEQREGRIIRQGNEFYEANPEGFEVGINRYATKMTYDTRMWQIIEHKAAGIEGFRRAERTTRVLEDVSGEAANAAEMKAASSGDPRIAREIMLRGDIAKLQALFDGWRQNRYRTESKINALNDHPRTHESLKKNREELIAKRDAATTDEFSYQLPSGNKVAKKAETLGPIVDILKAAKNGDQVAVGRYRGFMFTVERRTYSGGDYLTFRAAPIGAYSTQFRDVTTIYPTDELSGTGLIQRFDNYLAGFEGDITRDAAGVVRSLKESAELKETLKEGFKDEGKLEAMKAEHAALRAELMQSRGKRAAPSATPTSGAVDVVPKEAFLNMIDEAEGRGPLQASPTSPARPIASVIQSFEAAFPTFSTYMDENQTPAVRKEALRKIVKAESADVQAWREFANLDPEQALPEDAEAIREAKELLPEVERMQDVQAATGQPKVSIPDLHAAFVQAKRQQGTDSPTIRAVFDAAKVKNPRLSRQEFVSAIRNGHYTGLVTLRDGQGSIQVGGKGAMTLLPITDAEIMDAADNATETPEAILEAWAATEPLQASPTASRDAEYMAAVEAGDMEKAQRMVDEAAKAAGYDSSSPLYFGAREKGLKITEIGDSLFVTDDTEAAKDYAHSENEPQSFYLAGKVAEIQDLDIDWSSSRWSAYHLEDGEGYSDLDFGAMLSNKKHRRTIAYELRKAGFTALHFSGDVSSYNQIEHDSWLVAAPNQIKSADPVTRDDAGNVIPLSQQRFNPASDSILYATPTGTMPTAPRVTHEMPDGYQLTEEGMQPLMASPTAYHGTPHKVDKFTTAKIGTGEGVQAYGWGLYFAEARKVAEDYRRKLSADKPNADVRRVRTIWDDPLYSDTNNGWISGEGNLLYYDSLDALALDVFAGKKTIGDIDESKLDEVQAILDSGDLKEIIEPGNLYTVELLPDEDEFLDWDKPLSEQGEKVKGKLRKAYIERGVPLDENGEPKAFSLNPSGEKLYAFIGGIKGEEFGSKFLNDFGVPGIRYADGQSRVSPLEIRARKAEVSARKADVERDPSATNQSALRYAEQALSDLIRKDQEGTRNYVIFDENLVRILEENGRPVESPLQATPTDKKPRRTIDPATQGDTPTTESNRANPGDSPLNRRAAANARAKYEAEEMTQANFDELRSAVAKELERDLEGNLEDIEYKLANIELNGGGLSIEDQEKVRQLGNKLSYQGRLEGDRMMRERADRLYIANADIGSELGRGMALRRDQFKTPQERLDDAMGNILAPSQTIIRERTINVKTKKERDAIITEIIRENDAKVDAILKRNGLTQTDLFLSVDDRYALQEAILDLARVHLSQQSEQHKKAIEMSVRGYSDNAIAKETGLPLVEVSNTAEHFRNVVAKQAAAKYVQAGGTFGKLVRAGKGFLSAIKDALFATPTAPLGNLVAKGTPTAAAVAAQIQAILNASIPTKGQRNAMTFHAATAKGKNGQNVKVFVPYDPSDWKQVYRTARELSTREATWLDKGYEYWINGILSGPQTHVVNTASNVLSTAWAYGPQWFAEATANVMIRNPNSPQFGEFKHVFAGFWKGVMPALRNFALAWSTEADPVEHQYLDKPVTAMFQGGNLDKVGGIRPSIGGAFGRIVRVPGRFLVAQDAFAKTLIMHAESAAMAYRLGKKQGLAGSALENFMASQIATHGSESWQHAFEKAVELTFQDENDITKAVESVSNSLKRAKLVGWLFKFLLPFVRTPTNIYRAGIRKAGGSAGMLLYRLGKSGYYAIKGNNNEFRSYREGKMVKDVSESVMALALWYFIMGMSEGDDDDNQKAIEITGSRPFGVANAGERASQLRQEGGSNLVIIRKNPLTGEKLDEPLRLPYGRYEPIALAVSTLVDGVREFKEWSRLKPQDRTTNALAGSISKHLIAQAKDKTFLQGISGFMDFLEDMGGKNLSLQDIAMKNLFNGAIPNLIRQPYRNIQDTVADSKKADSELSRSLGIGEAKVNEAGKPVTRQGNIVSRVLFPVPTTPSTSLFDAALKKWNASNPGQQWNPDPLTKGDWFVYDPKLGSQKGKVSLTDSRQISLFETMVGLKFASLAARALVKEGYRPGQPVSEKMFEAIKKARTDAITKTRQRHPSEFRTSKP